MTAAEVFADHEVLLVLQGGGARAAYQVGVFEALQAVSNPPRWVVGISMGALNAAILAGNPADRRKAALTGFWTSIATPFDWSNLARGPFAKTWKTLSATAEQTVGLFGHRNFYRLHGLPYFMAPPGTDAAVSYYSDAPLARNLARWVDFDYLNDHDRADRVNLSIGVTDVETGLLDFFHSDGEPLSVDHLRAAAAQPPGSAAVQVGDRWFWDGGVAGNEPLVSLVSRPALKKPMLMVVVDLWSARGRRPKTVAEASWRNYEVTYQSKITALLRGIDRAARARRGPRGDGEPLDLTVVQLTYSDSVGIEPHDAIDFSLNSIEERAAAGRRDTAHAIEVVADAMKRGTGGLQLFTFDGMERTRAVDDTPTQPNF